MAQDKRFKKRIIKGERNHKNVLCFKVKNFTNNEFWHKFDHNRWKIKYVIDNWIFQHWRNGRRHFEYLMRFHKN